ncbi:MULTISPECIES: hypothetical protein [Pseudonocardia]|uniref:Antibiotic biosynthesis monooxygenase n=2 Tax=Pseudonocardia TaxID=1847 RepID=A0A1Y2N3W7_PSEAH|nr:MULTISPECIES: hypothetical protein [Pseudonocardia]OSY42160.1 hypothetical protein BG845_01658 [Pseudonocardia autotrophica]TDN75072.1 hypothetical protein C8E95_4213 [Pseudonocardia autotrophica]BBF99016.1 hypothetical protein Pdca_02260 [Pseudonocardia autotrophica]GEC23936.1 hypothetical protein PSA01_09650 [Pseudonocardia saturnea]
MDVRMVQFSVDPGDVAAVEQSLERMCAAIETQGPAGTRFAACKLADGVSFLNILQLDDGMPNPLPSIEACRDFQQQLPGWELGDQVPAAEPVAVIGSHGLF